MSGRVVHVRDAVPGAVYVGVGNPREGLAESAFANPFRVPQDGNRQTVIVRYLRHVLASPALLAMLPVLRGKPLACWCRHEGDQRPGAPACHADVLLELLEQHSDEELRAMAEGGGRRHDNMDALQQRIGAWAERTFPHHTDLSVFRHLLEEVDELTDAYHEWGSQPRSLDEVAADVVILLMTLMHRRGISLAGAIAAKQAINERREWGAPDASGIAHHVGHRG
jgi:NTP pyrophosphatase (non-canonical NTP hydrolase)